MDCKRQEGHWLDCGLEKFVGKFNKETLSIFVVYNSKATNHFFVYMNVVLGAKLILKTTLALQLLVFIVWFSFKPKDGVVVQLYIWSRCHRTTSIERKLQLLATQSPGPSCLINASSISLFLFCIGAIRINIWALKSCDRNNLNIYSESYVSSVLCKIPSPFIGLN